MTLVVRSEPLPSGDALRKLVISALSNVLGGATMVVPELPVEGNPILALGPEGEPVVVSFDAEDPAHALMTGLAALEAVAAHAPWLIKLCPQIPDDTPMDRVRLVSLAPAHPPGMESLVAGAARVTVCAIRAVRVNGEVGMLIDPYRPKKTQPDKARIKLSPFRTGHITLSDAEEAFFQTH